MKKLIIFRAVWLTFVLSGGPGDWLRVNPDPIPQGE